VDRSQILRVMIPMGGLSALLLIVAVVVVLTGGAKNPNGFTLSTEPVVEPPPSQSVVVASPGTGSTSPETGSTSPGTSSTRVFDSIPLDDPNWKFVSEASLPGLKFLDYKVGDGEVVPPGVSVKARYTGWRTDGVKFDSSFDSGNEPIEFSLNGVIVGWTQGLPGMKVGGVRRLYIPSQFAYGSRGSGAKIPPNTDLVFEVEMVSCGSHRR
jgi:hypothetical protein